MFFVERENSPIRQPFFGFVQRRFKNEFADGLTRSRCRRLQRLFSGLAKPKVKFLCSVCSLGSHIWSIPNLPDNVKTNVDA